jgi:hypothetical protein
MKLGKALATGVAEERPEAHEEEAGLQAVQTAEAVEDVQTPAPEGVAVAR